MFRTFRTLPIALASIALVATACGSSNKSAGVQAPGTSDGAMHESTTVDAMHSTPTTVDAMHATPTTGAAMMSHTGGAMSSSYIKAADQESDGTKVTAEDVVLTGGSGWVTVQADNGGAMGDQLGVSRLVPPGTTMGVAITLTKPLTASGTVFLVLHREDNNNSTFDGPTADAPAQVGGKVVEVPVHVTVK